MLIDHKSSVWFTLGSEEETLFCDTLKFFQLDCRSRFSKSLWLYGRLPVTVFKILNGRQSGIFNKFHQSINPFPSKGFPIDAGVKSSGVRQSKIETFSYEFFLSTANRKPQLEVSRLPSEVRTFLSI